MFELKHQPPKRTRRYPNSKSGLLSWEEALDYIHEYQYAIEAVLCYTYFDIKKARPASKQLDLSTNWDISSHKPKAKDFIFNLLGVADWFEIIH